MLTLQTLKSKPVEEQVRTIEELTDRNLSLYERIRPLLEDRARDSILQISVSNDRREVVRIALIAVTAADIATIPDQVARAPYRRRLDRLCRHFAIDTKDLADMVRHAAKIEGFLTDSPQPSEEAAQ